VRRAIKSPTWREAKSPTWKEVGSPNLRDQLLKYVLSTCLSNLSPFCKNTIDYVFTLAGGTISWLSKLHDVVAMLTIKA